MTMVRFSLIVLLCSFCMSCGPSHPDAPLPRKAPYARLFLTDGSISSVRAHRDKTAVVLFWASWCSYSKTDIQKYNELARRLGHHKDLVFIAVSVDNTEAQAEVQNIIQGKNLDSMIHAYSGNEVADEAYYLMKGGDLPHFMVVSKQGEIVLSEHDIESVEDYLASLGY